MNFKSLVLSVFALALLAVPARAQLGLYSNAGFGVGVAAQSGDDYLTAGADLAYMINGLVQAGVEISNTSTTCDGCDYSAFVFTPNVMVFPVREGDRFPVTVGVGGHMHLIANNVDDVSESGWGFSALVSKLFSLTGLFGVRPTVEIAYTGYKSEYSAGGMTSDYTSNPIYYTVGALFSTTLGPGTVYFGPFFEGASEDGSSSSQVGFKAAIALTK